MKILSVMGRKGKKQLRMGMEMPQQPRKREWMDPKYLDTSFSGNGREIKGHGHGMQKT